MKRFLLSFSLATTLLACNGLAWAAIWPDTVAPCNGTLQACVDAAAAGDTVQIVADDPFLPDAYTAINEPITIRKSLTLTAAPGIDAVFGPGFNVGFQPNVPGPHQVTISGLVLRQGSVNIRDTGSVAGSVFRVERMTIVEPTATNAVPCAINFDLQSPTPQVTAGDNVISGGDTPGELRSGICAFSGAPGGSVTANIFRNRITTGAAGLRGGIRANVPTGGGSISISANTVLGPQLSTGIAVQRAEGSATAFVQIDNNVVAFQSDVAGWGLQIEGGNSTVTVVNNTVVHGARGMLVTGFDLLPVSGRVASNLVAFHSGLGVRFDAGGLTNSHNLVFGNAGNDFTAGPFTLTIDPQLERPGYPRLVSGSPAIDTGSTGDVPTLALFDADGERRVAFGTVDIGAFEATGDGAERITASPATTFFNEVYVTPFPVPLVATDTLVAVSRWAAWPMGVSALNLGVYTNPTSPSGWSVFLQQNSLIMPSGADFHVLAPKAGKTGFAHTTDVGNISGARSTIDNTTLNGALNRSRIAVALHSWNGLYHDVPIGMSWVSTGGGRWQVRNENGAVMPAGLNFNVVAAPFLSPNAFRATLDSFASQQWRLDHPLLNGNPCAAPIVGRADDPDLAGDIANTVGFGVRYDAASGAGAPGRWVVRADATSGTPLIPAGASFHVIIDGAQANRCRAPVVDAVFANGFE